MDALTVYVGQGELIGIRHLGEAVIVDSRWPEERAGLVDSTLRAFLGDSDVVGLILTGFDNDHADPKGIDRILGQYEPAWLMYPKYYKGSQNSAEVFRVIEKHERRRSSTGRPLKRLPVRLDLNSRRQLQVPSTNLSYELFSPHADDMDNSNNCSIVLKVTGTGSDGFSFLITGDTENERWDTIAKLFGDSISSEVLSAPHHGSKNAAHTEMARLVSPDTVLVSAGVDNQYGHPDQEALTLFRRSAREVLQTNLGRGVSLLTQCHGGRITTHKIET